MQFLNSSTLIRMIETAAARIRANEKELSALDSATGDGDHGMTICRVMDAESESIVRTRRRDGLQNRSQPSALSRSSTARASSHVKAA